MRQTDKEGLKQKKIYRISEYFENILGLNVLIRILSLLLVRIMISQLVLYLYWLCTHKQIAL